MPVRKVIQLRRRRIPVGDVADNVILEAVLLGCALCGQTWPASLGQSGDEVPEHETRCPHCTPEPPRAA